MVRTEVPSPLVKVPVRAAAGLYRLLANLGDQLLFYLKVFGWTGRTARRYRTEIARLVAQVSLGRGGMALVAGTIGIVILETSAVGVVVGLAGFEGLRQIGAEAFMGFISAYFNTREAVPLIAANALIATVGAGFTAEIGAMRIHEEIDALEVMAVPSIPYLVTTRVIATVLAIIPIYIIALFFSYLATESISVFYFAQTPGTYEHYFDLFLPPIDIVYSFVKALVFAVVMALVMCYYGFRARGGPAGVGVAVGRAVRLTLVLVVILDFFISLMLWGATATVRIAG
ncbi:ABC-type transport system involved in resistance to organic solvents, permease component [Saccharomonospora marina XMU15]|uniref:ABC-type transport system involved in resistance to organic solvents, permease component n=1 Tax=Saccharomonospora marina XMU15 TaxID=882083 RepID=H5X8F7_9PSEU|nr:ABC transporter permease [Saccharomonospora marina]EHR50253.1 ABC-type transport system involved in resistance to organic solvents, permease component [Saccharomonospora marina XMU15]